MKQIDIGLDEIDALMPMHLVIDSRGYIVSAGRAIVKLAGDANLLGALLIESVVFEKPVKLSFINELVGRRVGLRLRRGNGVRLRGHGVSGKRGNVILNLALALSEMEALEGFGLTAAEFAPTDPTLDMLYLMEAKALATAETHRLISRLQDAKRTAETEATTDPLTGLVNRRGFDHILNKAITAATPFALAHVDLDHFKAINDGFGHPAGDAVLIAVAQRLRNIVRASDTVARVGGDEFTIVFHRLTDREILGGIARRIVEGLEDPIVHDGDVCRVSASIGIAISSERAAASAETLIAGADDALYRSKADGRARHTFASYAAN